MVQELLRNILTKVQYKKISKLFETYPQLLQGEDIIESSVRLGEVAEVKTDKVFRDFSRIGEITGRLTINPVYVDSWDKTKVIDDPFGHEEEEIKRGGKGKSRYFKIKWKVYSGVKK